MTAPVIAMVEDEPAVLLHIDHLLDAAGYGPCWCMQGADALPLIRRLQPDLVILALPLAPPRAGDTVTEQLARDSQTSRIPLIIYAADLSARSAQARVLQYRGYVLLSSPCAPQALLTTIQATLAHTRMKQGAKVRRRPG